MYHCRLKIHTSNINYIMLKISTTMLSIDYVTSNIKYLNLSVSQITRQIEKSVLNCSRNCCVSSQIKKKTISVQTSFVIIVQHLNLPHLNHYICLLVLSGQTLLVTPSLTCSLAANFHLNYLQTQLKSPPINIFFSFLFFYSCFDIVISVLLSAVFTQNNLLLYCFEIVIVKLLK